jgi:hypothetical protein
MKRLGDSPVVCEFESNGATIEIAGKADHAALAAGPFTTDPAPGPLPTAPVSGS